MGTYRCICDNGYEVDATGKICTDINECELEDSLCSGGQCRNTPGSFQVSELFIKYINYLSILNILNILLINYLSILNIFNILLINYRYFHNFFNMLIYMLQIN